ncbi:MAG: transglutaminase domain-containing protein [Thermoplasmatota archaeon]
MNWPGRIVIVLIAALLLSTPIISISSGGNSSDRESSIPTPRSPGMDPIQIYDDVVKVPPGGETTISFGPDMEPTEGGYVGLKDWNHGKLGEASELLPGWLQEPFKENMIKAASREISLGPSMIPAFGDLDGDGDDDLVIGASGSLYFYRNIGRQGNPIYIQGGWDDWKYIQRTQDPSSDFISPSILDIEGDGYGDIIWGDSTHYLNFIWNRGIGNGVENDQSYFSLAYVIGQNPPTHISPAPITGENNTFRTYFGCRQGSLYYWEFDYEDSGYDVSTSFHMSPSQMVGLGALNFSSPRLFKDPRIAPGYHNIHGMAVGSGEGIIRYYPLIDGHYTQSQTAIFLNIAQQGSVTPVPSNLNGDLEVDLVLGTTAGNIPVYPNFQTNDNPYWAPDPHVPAFQIENYESAFGMNIMEYNESLIEEILDLIITPPNTNYRDEIGFCCAYMPPSQLIGSTVDDLLRDNAYYIYSRDDRLEYVSLKEYSGDDYYTTAEYRVRNGNNIQYMEIPRDIYYWGIVHPRVTEEQVAYVSPDNGQPTHPDNGGRFWREYVFDHADETYPEGPEYPDDWTGPVAYYPTESSPPLLRDVLKDVDVLWDLMPYDYPRGFDNNGENNGHLWDYRDHAIEKVSHWVEKTLVINQQESPDDERPTQPVRIAHHHNGNCGELQDLTIAAARSSLIPARGILLMGEDHVWSEFYLGGWHQWDNYWSDAGGVVADNLNYWWGWGGRGGSGLMAYMGDGQAYDVGSEYRSPDVTAELVVEVVDGSGDPVDGARVLVFSHWVMEQINVDLGPYQGPLPATVPMPSIWGYTNQSGICSLNIWRQNFNYRVVSDIGTFVSEKFTMPDTGSIHHTVQLDNEMPEVSYTYQGLPQPEDGRKYLVYAELIGTEQSQTDFISGVGYKEKLDTGTAEVTIFADESGQYPRFIDVRRIIDRNTPYMRGFYSGDLNVTISLRSLSSIKSNNLIRVRIYEVDESGGGYEPSLLIFNPLGKSDTGFENGEHGSLAGMILDPANEMIGGITNISISGLSVDPVLSVWSSERYPEWSIPWTADGISGSPGSMNPISMKIETRENPDRIFQTSIYIVDTKYPHWTSIRRESVYSWGEEVKIGLDFSEEIDIRGWIGFDPIGGDQISGGWEPSSGEWTIDSTDLPSGGNRFRMVMIDTQDNLQTLTFGFWLDPLAPNLTVSTPRNGSQFVDNTIEIVGSVTDDVSLSSFKASASRESWDLLDTVDETGRFRTEISLDPRPGPVVINFTAVDNVGLASTYLLYIEILERPDITPPTIEIKSPRNGDEIERGEILTIKGTAEDDRGIASIVLSTPVPHDLTADLSSLPSWEREVDTSYWPTGETVITVEVTDTSGNTGTDKVRIEIYEEEIEFVDRRDPEILVLSPDPNDEVSIGEMITVTGRLSDDGDEIGLFISSDGGDTMMDITSHVETDWSFAYTLDTAEFVKGLSLSPDRLVQYLEEFQLILMAEDGSGKTAHVNLPLSVTDSADPVISELKILPFDGKSPDIDIRATIRDNTMIEMVRFTLIDDLGRVVEEDEITGDDIEGGNGEYTVNWSFERPINPGSYVIEATAADPWGNSDVSRLDLAIPAPENDETDERISIFVIIGIILGSILILLLVIYGAVRMSRKLGKNRQQ